LHGTAESFCKGILMLRRFAPALVGAALVLSACGPRQVEVRTAAQTATALTLEVHNTLAQGVNVYVVQNGVRTFLRQVGAGSTVSVPVQGVATGSTVRLEATTIDGVHTYSRDNVTLNGNYVFQLP
jgi:hypothetical protein